MKIWKAILWSLGLLVAGVPAIAAAQSAPAPALKYPWQPQEPQGYYTQTWHDGFRAGAAAANLDLEKKIKPDIARHTTYRNPDLAPVASEDFQAGFAYAYQTVVAHRYNPAAGVVPPYLSYYGSEYGPY